MKQTPAEQAMELVKRFETAISEESMDSKGIINYSAKQCALIANDKEIESVMWINILCNSDNYMKQVLNDKVAELKQLKTEIENL